MARLLLVQNTLAEQLGVMHIAAVARARGHELALTFGPDREVLRAARRFRPDIVGISVMTGFQERWIRVARALKQAHTPAPLILFGGPHPTFFPEVAREDAVDVVFRGESEEAFGEFLEAYGHGEREFTGIANVVTAHGGELVETPLRPLADLDDLPFADREISFAHRFIREDPCAHYAAGRGCPHACSFCYTARYRTLCRGLGKPVRLRSAEHLVAEIAAVNRRWGERTPYFIDDTFCLNSKWLFGFLELYSRDLRLPFFCQVRADQVTEDLARALKDAGCYRLSMGVESGSERLRNEVLNKRLSDDQLRSAAAILRRVGLPFQTTNMMGLPGERLDDAFKTIELNREIGTATAWTSLYQPYPGTALGDRALAEGLIDRFPDDEALANAHTGSALHQPEIEEIVRLHKFVYLAHRHPWTLPLIRRLVKRDFPRLFLAVHRLTYFWYFFVRERILDPKRILEEALVALKYYR